MRFELYDSAGEFVDALEIGPDMLDSGTVGHWLDTYLGGVDANQVDHRIEVTG